MNLEQQKKRARELLRGIRAGDAEAIQRLRRHHSRWAEVDEATLRQLVALHDAQFALAREQGFPSWPKLRAYAEPRTDSRHTRLFVANIEWIDERVAGLLHAHKSAVPAALEQIREWHPRFADATDDDIRQARFDEEDARLVYAREHGFESWHELASRIDALAHGRAEEPFMAAYKALEVGDLPRLQALLRAHPELARARGTNGNTLLNLESSMVGSAKRTGAVGRNPDRPGRHRSVARGWRGSKRRERSRVDPAPPGSVRERAGALRPPDRSGRQRRG